MIRTFGPGFSVVEPVLVLTLVPPAAGLIVTATLRGAGFGWTLAVGALERCVGATEPDFPSGASRMPGRLAAGAPAAC